MILTFENYKKEKYSNKKLIIVDIQPSYRIHMNMDMQDFTNWLNHHNYFEILYLYNGPDLGYEDENEIKTWLEDYGLNSFDNITFYEKGYAFFRDLMDGGCSDEQIISLGKYMIDNHVSDITELTDEQKTKIDKGLVDSMWLDGYQFYIPGLKDELDEFLINGDRPLLIGGGEFECFKEVLLLLQMLDFDWDKESQFIY